MTERRRFIATAGGALAATAAAAITDAPNVIAQPKIQWRMSTAWTPANDILQGAAQQLAKIVEETSGGRFRIEVFPGGQIIPPFECFDAASKGTVEAFMAVSAYWAAREPAFECFHTVPFGMNPEGMAAWFQVLGSELQNLVPERLPGQINRGPHPQRGLGPRVEGGGDHRGADRVGGVTLPRTRLSEGVSIASRHGEWGSCTRATSATPWSGESELLSCFPIFFRPLVSLPHLTPTNQAQSHRTLGAQLSAARLFPGWDAARHPQAASEAHRHLVGRARAVPGGRALLAELPLPGRTVVTAGPASVLVLLPTATRRRARCHRVSPVYPGRFGPRAPPYSALKHPREPTACSQPFPRRPARSPPRCLPGDAYSIAEPYRGAAEG